MNKAGFPLGSLIDNVFLPMFNKHGEESFKFLCTSSVSRISFLVAYRYLPPIENLPKKEKIDLMRYVIALFPEQTNPEKMQSIKIIYTIGNLLND